MLSSQDWFRNKRWSRRLEHEFFDKLARARSQRDQYLAIQALTLAKHEPVAALRLVDHYFETRKKDFHDIQALSARVDAYSSLGEMPKVIENYQAILAREAKRPSHKTTAYVDFPYLVATENLEDQFDFALTVLESRKRDVMFPLDRFKWHAAYALISANKGDLGGAQKHAESALSAAEADKSGFRYHQNLGLVGKEHKETLRALRKLQA